jgi:hypothetical protein
VLHGQTAATLTTALSFGNFQGEIPVCAWSVWEGSALFLGVFFSCSDVYKPLDMFPFRPSLFRREDTRIATRLDLLRGVNPSIREPFELWTGIQRRWTREECYTYMDGERRCAEGTWALNEQRAT